MKREREVVLVRVCVCGGGSDCELLMLFHSRIHAHTRIRTLLSSPSVFIRLASPCEVSLPSSSPPTSPSPSLEKGCFLVSLPATSCSVRVSSAFCCVFRCFVVVSSLIFFFVAFLLLLLDFSSYLRVLCALPFFPFSIKTTLFSSRCRSASASSRVRFSLSLSASMGEREKKKTQYTTRHALRPRLLLSCCLFPAVSQCAATCRPSDRQEGEQDACRRARGGWVGRRGRHCSAWVALSICCCAMLRCLSHMYKCIHPAGTRAATPTYTCTPH